MPSSLPQLALRCATWLRPRRALAGVLVAGTICVAVAIVAASKTSAQTSLFAAPLAPSQTIEIEHALTLWNEPFRADTQQTAVFVSVSRRRDVLLRLTLAGLPHRFVPTSADVLAERQSPFDSQSVVDDRRRTGVQGDLVAALRRVAGVADASVVIAPASDDPLAPEAQRSAASASVQLVMQSGAQLSGPAVSGIKRYVAASYPGLAPERVVVVDGSGGAMAGAATADGPASHEMRLQRSIQSALDAVFGIGAAIVRVSLRPLGEERQSQTTRVTPHGLLEAERGSEHGSDNGKRFQRQRERTRYAYDTVTETRSSHADAIARVAVAVFLDARKIGLDQSKLVADLVRASAGADLSSGDQVVVQALPFRDDPPSLQSGPRRLSRLWGVVAALAMLAVAAGLMTRFRAFEAASRLADDRSQASAARALHSSLERELPQTAAYVLSGLPQRVRDRVLREYPVEQRERISRHLNGRAHV